MKLLIRAASIGTLIFMLPPSIHAGDTIGPKIPPVPAEKGDQCVEPTDVMRRSHMDFILHERDETVHNGIRGSKHSLTGCIDCHVNPGPDGQYASSESEEHFCSACHTYAAVKIDCFQCHADYPVESSKFTSMKVTHPHAKSKKASLDIEDFQPLLVGPVAGKSLLDNGIVGGSQHD